MVESKKDEEHVCSVCGKPSEEAICLRCQAKIRGEALEHKIGEEKAGKTDSGRK